MATEVNIRLYDMKKDIRAELRHSPGNYICNIGDYAIFSASIGWSDVHFMYAKRCEYIFSHIPIDEEETSGTRLYFLNDNFAKLIGYKDLSDMKKRLPSIQYHRRFISLKAIDRAIRESKKKRQRNGKANKIIHYANPIFNNTLK